MLSLNDACIKIQDGTHFSPKIGGSQYKYITSKNIGKGSLSLNNVDMISEEEHRKIYKRCDVKMGDVLLTKDGINTGNAAINHLNEEFSLLSSVAILRIDTKYHNNLYLMYQLLSNQGQARITNMISGNAITRLTLEKIRKLSFPFPSTKHEQKLIDEKISSIDSLITSLEKLIEKKKLIKKGVMQELLTGKGRLPGFSGEWETKRLGDVSVVIMGQSPDSKYYNTDSKGIPLIQGNADIQNGKSVSRIWTKSITKECQKGAILITVRAPVGSVGISSSRACLGRGVCAVQPYSVNERYLYWQLKFSEDKWNESQQGSTFTSVNSNQIKDFCILCPTSFDEQAAIADVIEDIEIEIDLHIKQLNKQILLKQAMMQELLTGRIRLI